MYMTSVRFPRDQKMLQQPLSSWVFGVSIKWYRACATAQNFSYNEQKILLWRGEELRNIGHFLISRKLTFFKWPEKLWRRRFVHLDTGSSSLTLGQSVVQQKVLNGPKLSRMDQNGQKLSRMDQNGPKLSRMDQNGRKVLKNPKRSRNGPEESRKVN